MPKVVKANPTSPGRRHYRSGVKEVKVYKGRPWRALTTGKKKRTSGRNHHGRITVRHRGGGHKRLLREIDFRRNSRDGILATVERIEKDPNRTALIALILYATGERAYIICPKGLRVGDTVVSGPGAPIKVGNCLPLSQIPDGTQVHCVELNPGGGAIFARSAGASIQVLARDGRFVTLRTSGSKEVRRVPIDCRATIGAVGNDGHNLRSLGKAGRRRWMGFRPTVRGVAMNPVDHPHGGGEGRTSGGGHPVSPWGLQTKGKKTRHNKRTDGDILRRKGEK